MNSIYDLSQLADGYGDRLIICKRKQPSIDFFQKNILQYEKFEQNGSI